MAKAQGTVLVFWAERFDEAAAVLVSELRRAGLRVKLVSLAGQPAVGAHGVALVPDLSVDQALAMADEVVCVVVPSTAEAARQLRNDPRVDRLLAAAEARGAAVLQGEAGSGFGLAAGWPAPGVAHPGQGEGVAGFARELAWCLAAAPPAAPGVMPVGANGGGSVAAL